MIFLATSTQTSEWVPVIIQTLATAAAVFGGVGFWQWLMSRDQAKRDAESKKTGVENKVDALNNQFTVFNAKVDAMSEDMQDIKKDIVLLQEANEETAKYRELRDARDQEAIKAQDAIIDSLRGLLRDRLLDVYKQCITKGYYTKEERETYGELFRCYESKPFDGNGVMHQLRPIVQALPWTKEDAGKLQDPDSKD